ncbi:MAG: T9SS type A sorting domain-containing protein, partial [Ignavibacteriae bacterium]|nr:T9SS type A sorting domain-containing protein [Ignavibacteriota bacterium]
SNNFGNSWVSANGGQFIVYTQSVTSYNNDIYATSITNGVLKSINNGENWTNLGIPGVITNKISVINNNLYVGANNGVEKTSNQGSNWNNVLPLTSNGFEIESLSNYLFASTENGVYRSSNNGENWELISFSGQTINCLLVFNNALFAGLENSGIWFSDDYGLNWLFLGLENVSVYSLASYGNGIFAGTNDGFYYTVDNGINWNLNNEGFPGQPHIKSIFVSDPYVLVGTTFHSIYKRELQDFGFTISPILQSPENNAVQVSQTPVLMWNNAPNSSFYEVVLANNPNFNNYLISQIVSETFYQVPNNILNPIMQYYWKVRCINNLGISEWSEIFTFATLNSTNITNNIPGIPKNFDLHNNYPNPFNPSTKIQFDVPKNSIVKINVYDITGREITTLVNDFRNAGRYEVQFNASNLSSGIYFYKMQAGDYNAVKKMMLIK